MTSKEYQYEGYYTAASSLRNFFQTLPQLQNCRNKLGRQFVQLLGNGLTVGSYFINPALSVAMSGASSVITTAMDAIYEIAKKRKVYKLSESTLPTALSCSSEVLTNMYCETLRAERIVKKYADWEEDQVRTWEGIPFVIRRITPLIDWLELVRAGSPASDSFDAQRRLEVMELNSTLDELKQKV